MSKDAKTEEKLHGAPAVRREVYDWAETFCTALFVVVLIFTFVVRFVTVDGDSMMTTLHHGDRLIITSTPYTPQRGDIVVIHDSTQPMFSGPIIKRVIATEGETVRVNYHDYTITVIDKDGNETVLDESAYVSKLVGIGGVLPEALQAREKIYGKENVYIRIEPDEYDLFPARDLSSPAYAMYYPDAVPAFDENNPEMTEHVVEEGHVFVCGDNRNHSLDSRAVGDIDERMILGKVLLRLACGNGSYIKQHRGNPFWDFGTVKHG